MLGNAATLTHKPAPVGLATDNTVATDMIYAHRAPHAFVGPMRRPSRCKHRDSVKCTTHGEYCASARDQPRRAQHLFIIIKCTLTEVRRQCVAIER